MVSFPAGVQKAHQTFGGVVGARTRTLPSAMPTSMPAAWLVEARVGSHMLSTWIGSVPGCVWNRDPGPLLNEANVGLKVASAFGHAHRLPPRVEKCGEADVHTGYFSAKRMVVDVPSGNEAGITAAPCQRLGLPFAS